MQITSLEQMESIVNKSRSLSWDGWTVVSSKPSPVGWSKPSGALIDGKWHLTQRFEPGTDGWIIPDKFVS
jgi:hypothetical protein